MSNDHEPASTWAVFITRTDGSPLAGIRYDGTAELWGDHNEASRIFWDAVSMFAKENPLLYPEIPPDHSPASAAGASQTERIREFERLVRLYGSACAASAIQKSASSFILREQAARLAVEDAFRAALRAEQPIDRVRRDAAIAEARGDTPDLFTHEEAMQCATLALDNALGKSDWPGLKEQIRLSFDTALSIHASNRNAHLPIDNDCNSEVKQ